MAKNFLMSASFCDDFRKNTQTNRKTNQNWCHLVLLLKFIKILKYLTNEIDSFFKLLTKLVQNCRTGKISKTQHYQENKNVDVY